MEGPRDDGKDSTAKLTLGTSPRALAELNYNALIAPDRNASSDDDVPEDAQIPAEDARTAIGVSISREQIRLTSPQTPAVEKAAAIDRQGGFFGVDGSVREATLLEEPEEDEEVDVEDEDEDVATEIRDNEDDSGTSTPLAAPKIPERSPRRTPVRLPSPWRAESSVQWYQNNKGRSGIFDGLFNRKRSSTGPDTTLAKSFLSSLPSIPKSFSIGSSSTGTNDVKTMSRTTSNESPKAMSFKPPSDFEKNHNSSAEDPCEPASGIENTSKSTEVKDRHAALEAVVSPASAPSVRSRAALLRRSTSDQSLVTQRTLSRVETLGDDSRFENVQDQVNSRFKAIKDSWQDSNIRLPSLPNISIASFTPDFIRERSGSLNKRSSIRPVDSVDSTSRSVESGMKPQKPVDPMTRQPYSTTREAVADATSGKPSTHPNFKRALEQLEDDVVILGGYRGSILRSADPPHRQLWVPVKVGLNLRKVDMQVGFEEDGDERATDRIIPGGMLTHIGPVDIARRLFKRLRNCKNAQSGKLRVYDYGYDWRLDPNYLSNQLISFLEGLPCNQPKHRKERRGAIVIAHSLGGLITRHAVNQRPDLFRGVVYAGVPTTCVNILGPLRNGDEVLLSNRVLTAQVNFSIRTSFALLPLDGRCFFDKNTGEEYPVDFFDPETWIDLRLSPCVGRALPPLVPPPRPGGITGYVSSVTSALPSISLPGRKASVRAKSLADPLKHATVRGAIEPDMAETKAKSGTDAFDNGDTESFDDNENTSIATVVTIPREKAIEYLTRTLASVKRFKQDTAFSSVHAEFNDYPPISVIYGKSTPTVYGAKVDGREGIKHADAYDQLAFASGDGVVLARAAMVPEGYKTARGGVVSSERGHVTLLSDLEAVGKCLNAIMAARSKGVGLGSRG